ncbi:autotransporter outer membrane beta-barrel domain-containing protein [Helicobacter kayseriensis]|uniref:autotransporter outer membrane beta-barrel domain-containing protein n=1 Tax=Helicobacter kayseriensis TaxID=2905877 RepID=UPI001E5DC6D8|nr:autotransporter outer membrane beta-barrel domain-containing protein [Helicobacter kayseriensis]MCE3046825.1 autotransporter outer membrane beta-barrel domain-containing protein [Helicobacter kayseriensis]MCE3047873.1 autotransporter outer membrane beta-barrel domain-containing protein [Helicobacter kayseriensis]
MRRKILISCIASTLVLGANAEKEYQVDFTSNSGSYKKPDFSLGLQNDKDYLWNQSDGSFILNSVFPSPKKEVEKGLLPNVTATFKSDQNNYGILTLKTFSFTNAPTGASSIKAPTKEDADQKKLVSSLLKIDNDSSQGFREFVLGGGGNINILSGANLAIENFTQTTLQGTINVNAGGISKDTASYGYLNSSLKIDSQKDYATLTMKASLNLVTNNGNERTQERPESLFEANLKGNISWEGYTSIANQAKMNLTAGNSLKISSTISISPQEMKKITQDSLGNQSVAQEDRVKQTNLSLKAPKIELSGRIDVGLNAKSLETREREIDGIKIVEISQLPSDIGSIAEISADIKYKQSSSSSGTKPTGWTEVTKAQFIQTSGGQINVGKNSEVKITAINNKPSDSAKIFDDEDPYAITLSNITIQDQEKGNKILNLDVQAQLRETQEPKKETVALSEGAGKVLLQGKISLGENANAKIQAYDGIALHKDSSFALSQDSVLWLSVGERNISLENQGKIEATGGAFVLGETYKGTTQMESSLKNTGTILISNSMRQTSSSSSEHPVWPPEDQEETKTLNPSGLFLLGQKNTLDNQGSLIFDGFGNLTTMTSLQDQTSRNLEISNSLGKKGSIDVRGSSNTIASGGDLIISSQDISIRSKTVEEGEGDDKKNVTYEGELILRSNSQDPASRIVLGKEKPESGRDRVSVTGGTLRIESQHAGVDSYNLRLVDTTLDLTKLSRWEKDGGVIGGGGTFTNKRNLELGGNVSILVANEQGAFVNGEYQGKVANFASDLPTMKVRGENAIYYPDDASKTQGTFSFDNHANLLLQSSVVLKIGGDFNNNGSVIFDADQFGVGSIKASGKIIFDMTNHQGSENTVNPLIAIKHTNFYSLSLDRVYVLLESQDQIRYRVGNLIIDPSDGSDSSQRPRAQAKEGDESTLTYAKQQEYLKTEIENFLNGTGAYEGNENKVGIFLNGVAYVDTTKVGFSVVRSSAVSQIQSNSSPTGVIDQYLDILAGSDGQISSNKTQDMIHAITSSDSRAMEVLNNALESKNSLELEILKNMGSYDTPSLIQMADSIKQAMQAVVDIEKPLMEDFQKMQIVREIAVQNRMMRFSNPYVAEIELARYIQNLSKNRYAQAQQDIQSDVENPALPSYTPQDIDPFSYKHNFWASAISSTTKESINTSALYGMSAGYEYMPIANVLLGVYMAYGYSDFKSSALKNNAHNIDVSIYTRLYYGGSEVDLTLGYVQSINSASIQNNRSSLEQKLDFKSNAFDFSLRYGYIFKIPTIKGLFIKPQGTYSIYGVNIPTLNGVADSPLVYEGQLRGGMIFNLGAEIRQYVSAYSFLYLLPSFEYNLMNKNEGVVYFSGATNKLQYSSQGQAKGLFSIYAGGEGYISPDFSMNLSAGYKAGLDKEEHNISISAGFKYKF